MERIVDVLSNNLTTMQISRGRYEDLVIKEKMLDDIENLITKRAFSNKGILAKEVKIIYEMRVKRGSIETEESDGI